MKTFSRLTRAAALAATVTLAIATPMATATEDPRDTGAGPITLSAGETVEFDAYAGDTIHLGGSRCTLGFIFEGQDNPSGNKALTAGHCGDVGTEIKVADIPVGKIVDRESPAEGMLVPAGSTKGDWAVIDIYPGINVEPSGNLEGGRSIDPTLVAHEDALVPGARVCTKGSSTGENCGEIVSLTDNGYLVTDIYRFQGDSGGPLYFESNGAAAGVLSSTPLLNFGSIGSTDMSTSTYYRADLAVQKAELRGYDWYYGSEADIPQRDLDTAGTLAGALIGS